MTAYTGSSHRYPIGPAPVTVLERNEGRGPCLVKNEGPDVAYLQIGFAASPSAGLPIEPGGSIVIHAPQMVSACSQSPGELSITPGYGAYAPAGPGSGAASASGALTLSSVATLETINASQVLESIRDLLKNIDNQLSLIRDA